VIALVVAVLVVFFLSLFIGAVYGQHLQKKGEGGSSITLGIKSTASGVCILLLIGMFLVWPASFAWYEQPPINILYRLVSGSLRPKTSSGGLLPAQTYHSKGERQASESTYHFLHLLLTAAVTSAVFGVIASALAPRTAELFFPSGRSSGPKQPRSPFTNRPY
jgi:hypothetical protein